MIYVGWAWRSVFQRAEPLPLALGTNIALRCRPGGAGVMCPENRGVCVSGGLQPSCNRTFGQLARHHGSV
jgi:hypothetical protein